MRFAAQLFDDYSNPDEWINILKQKGYHAAYSPVKGNESSDLIKSYSEAAKKEDIIISEQGAWNCNLLSQDNIEHKKAITLCQNQLEVAEILSARCCVALSGSRGDIWFGPHKDNLSKDSFDILVDSAREIIDSVKPKRTYFAFEPMPWTYPNDEESYEKLIKMIDRPAFAVHYDPCNLMYSLDRYYNNAKYIKNFISKLGKYIRVCHCKDVSLDSKGIINFRETIPGTGILNYNILLKHLSALDSNLVISTEHIHKIEDNVSAEKYIRNQAIISKVKLK